MKDQKFFESLKKLSKAIAKFNPNPNALITVVDLKMGKKGGWMRAYLSIFPEKYCKDLINYFNKNQKSILSEIKKNLYLRYLPSKIVFYPSWEFKIADQVLKIIDESSKEEKGIKN